MKWITRSHVHADGAACPWLITRFADTQAEVPYVPLSQVKPVAQSTGAIPFDASDVGLGYHEGLCSFESTMLKYELKDPAPVRLSKIVHSTGITADAGEDPIARELERIAVGYSLRYPDDDENLANQFEVYDAFVSVCPYELAANEVNARTVFLSRPCTRAVTSAATWSKSSRRRTALWL
jgi:hypothetical protein